MILGLYIISPKFIVHLTKENKMIIISNKNRRDIVIYGNIVAIGYHLITIERFQEKTANELNLSEKQYSAIQQAIIKNQGRDTLMECKSHLDLNNDVLRRAVAYATQNKSIINWFIFMGAPDILEIIAQRDDLDEYAINQLAQSHLDSVRALIAKKPNLDDSLIKTLADDKSFIVRVMIAERDDIDDTLVAKLAKDKYWGIRTRIAKRAQLNEDIMELLSNDVSDIVVGIIARRHDLTPQIISKLAQHKSKQIQKEIRQHILIA